MTTIALTTPPLAALLAVSLAACAPRGAEDPTAEDPVERTRPIETVLADSTAAWMAVPGVEGTGLGTCDGAPCIVVYVAARTPEIEARIPSTVEGHPVRIEAGGRFEAREP